VIGGYGAGKTQALQQLNEALGTYQFGSYKALVCKVDLNHEQQTTRPGFNHALFRSASLAANEIRAALMQENTEMTNVVEVGTDIASTIADTQVPVAGSAMKAMIGSMWRYWQLSRPALKRSIDKLQLDGLRAPEMMIRWIQYSSSPSEKTSRDLTDYVQELADSGELFLVLTQILKASGYATVLVLVDQAEKLVGNRNLTDAFMPIYDPNGAAGLNLCFVFGGTEDVAGLKSSPGHGGFDRRFMDPEQCSCTTVELVRPIASGPDNDVERIRKVLADLKLKKPTLRVPKLDDNRVQEIQRQAAMLGPQISWPRLWRLVLADGVAAPAERRGRARPQAVA
jgi:hypothetical protein